ncbi:recombinase family protein [Paenibacillus dendritiformis]|uniref:recombinase family protein n=1 Tax=Paenibacillus dendritiformis TaxID=130049 RepID=UPI00248C35DB|nr:recombinase family protein [Paenibacillus dendritiformis]WGU92036.1 recombinase family protein [Paenibacillus dendritiformis]
MITLSGSQKLNKQELAALIGLIRAIVYARVSTDGQVEKYSLESQIEMGVNLAKSKGISEDAIIVLIEDGEAGDNPNRQMINYLIFLLQYGIGDHAIFLHPDRMSRHLHLQTEVSHKIWGAGKDFWFVEFDFDKENPESMLNFNIQGSISEYNKAKILANTKRGRITKVRKGLIPGLNRIYGYTFDKEQDILVENEEEKAVYLMMVDLLLLHEYSCSEIAEYLAENDIAPPKSDKWYATTVTRILKRETYMGTYYYGKTRVVTTNGKKKQVPVPKNEWYSISIPPYISKETHSKILERIKELRNSGSGRPSTNLLKGIAICGRCGRTVNSGGASKIKDKILKYYACSQNAKKAYKVGTGESNKTCRGKTWRVDLVDELIWGHITEVLKNPDRFIEAIIKKQADASEQEELLKSKEKYEQLKQSKKTERERYTEMYARGYIKTLQELDEKLAKVDKQIESLEDEINIVNSRLRFVHEQHDELNLLKATLSKYNLIISSAELDVEDKRKIVKTLLKKVVLHDDNTLDLYLTLAPGIIAK